MRIEKRLEHDFKSSHRLSMKWKFEELEPPRMLLKLSAQADLKTQKPCQIYFTKNPRHPEHSLTAIWK
jgi:hypothetical protein